MTYNFPQTNPYEPQLLRAGYTIRQYEDHQGDLAHKWYWTLDDDEGLVVIERSEPQNTKEEALVDALKHLVTYIRGLESFP